MSIWSKNINKGAFSSPLECPVCRQTWNYDPKNQVWRLDRWITPHLARYICKKCKTPVRYEISRAVKPSAAELTYMGHVGR